jgi:ferredoxin
MFKSILVRKSQGTQYIPDLRAAIPVGFRGKPVISEAPCASACNACTAACPSHAITLNPVQIDMGRCILCGDCEPVCPSSKLGFSHDFKLASTNRDALSVSASHPNIDPINMPEAYIVDAVRTPVGRRKGGLGAEHPADLGAHVIKGWSSARASTRPPSTTSSSAAWTPSVTRRATSRARAGWRLACRTRCRAPRWTASAVSSQQAVHFAAQAVMSGTQDLVVAGGVQQMTQIPISSAMMVATQFGFSDPFSGSKGWQARYGGQRGEPVPLGAAHRREVGPLPRRHGGLRSRVTSAPSAPRTRAASTARSCRTATCAPTRARAAHPREDGGAQDPAEVWDRLTAGVASQISTPRRRC